MAEVIDFNKKIKEKTKVEDTKKIRDDEELDLIKIVGKESFIGMCDLLEDLGYDPYSIHQTVKDIESFSFIASAIVSRYLNVDHPGTHMLDITGDLIEVMHSNTSAKSIGLAVVFEGDENIADNENKIT